MLPYDLFAFEVVKYMPQKDVIGINKHLFMITLVKNWSQKLWEHIKHRSQIPKLFMRFMKQTGISLPDIGPIYIDHYDDIDDFKDRVNILGCLVNEKTMSGVCYTDDTHVMKYVMDNKLYTGPWSNDLLQWFTSDSNRFLIREYPEVFTKEHICEIILGRNTWVFMYGLQWAPYFKTIVDSMMSNDAELLFIIENNLEIDRSEILKMYPRDYTEFVRSLPEDDTYLMTYFYHLGYIDIYKLVTEIMTSAYLEPLKYELWESTDAVCRREIVEAIMSMDKVSDDIWYKMIDRGMLTDDIIETVIKPSKHGHKLNLYYKQN